MSADSLFLSLVIPVYNEGHAIYANLKEANAYLDSLALTYEIVVVDDGSKDNTKQEVKRFIQDHPRGVRLWENGVNRGKGYAVKQGILNASGQYRIFTDADFATPLFEIKNMVKEFQQGAEIVIGSRKIHGAHITRYQPFFRRVMGWGFNCCIRVILFDGISDTQCGFKGFSRRVSEKIFPLLQCERYSFDVELLYLARRCGFVIKEMPIQWHHVGKSKIKMAKDSFQAFLDLCKIRMTAYKIKD